MTPVLGARLPRSLHPLAWWLWAIGLATAVSRTSNPILLLLALAVLGLVVSARRGEAPWARAYRYYLGLALSVIILRVVFRLVFPGPIAAGEDVLVHLPRLHLPDWFAGVQVGGPVTVTAVEEAALDGLRLATLLCCLGAANVLANPRRVLQLLPGALHELGTAVTVALSAAPQLVESVQRVRRAARLRGGPGRGLSALRVIAVPTLHDALERSLRLAAGMDCRGYGRSGTATTRSRHLTGVLLIAGLCGLCLGVYGLLDPSVSRGLGVGGFVAGALLSCAGLWLGGRRVARTRYRPDPWRLPEWVVVAGGVVAAVTFILGAGFDPTVLNPGVAALHQQSFPWLPLLALLVAGVAGLAAPRPYSAPGRPDRTRGVAMPAERVLDSAR
jgi:energy-coupling factor transport system permease protein